MEYLLNSFYLICLYYPNLIALYPFNLIRLSSFNSIRQNIHLIPGTGSAHGIRKIKAWERIIANTTWRSRRGRLEMFLDKTEYICQNDVGEGAAEAHAEIIDQSIRIRSIRDCRDIGTSDKEKLNSLTATFADVVSSLNHHIAIN